MPRKPIKFELDFMIKDIFPRFTVKQFDDVSFNIKPLNQGLDYDTSNMIGKIFVGVNNDMFMQTTDITVSSDNINILLDKNMLQKNGRAYAEIELTDEAGTITSSSFIFDIDPKIGEGGMIPGEYEGFVEKYERLISEFKAQINSSIDNSNNLIDKTIKNCNTSVDTKLSTVDSRLNSKVAEVDNKLNTVDSLVNTKITNINNTLNKKVSEVDSKLDTVDGLITAKVSDFERRFSALTSSQQQDAEVIEAREGEVSLKARLDRDIENPKKLYTSIEGTEISVDSLEGYLKDIEILGNTVQDQDNLADIRSVGDKLENQELYEIPVLSTGKNLLDIPKYYEKQMQWTTGNYSTLIAYVKLNPNTDYTFTSKYSKSDNVVGHGGIGVYLFTSIPQEKDKWYITQTDVKTIFITEQPNITINKRFNTENYKYLAVYLGIATNSSHNHTAILENTQLEEGTQATPYEPYQEHKLTILSPVQLEKVGDVADRIVEKDGVWGVEKNINTITLNGSESNWVNSGAGSGNSTMLGMWVTISDPFISPGTSEIKHLSYPLQSKAHSQWNSAEIEGTHLPPLYNNRVYVNILLSNLAGTTEADFLSWLRKNPQTIKYQLATSQFIPLPHDQQIKLRTFANKTNIHFECEIEPTLKASVPKSIGASVSSHSEQIDNLTKELEKINNLEESVTSEVISESDFTCVENTSNGYFEDVKLEGRTLVNLYPKLDAENYRSLGAILSDDTITIKADGGWKDFVIKKDVLPLKTSTYYTFVIHIIDNTIEGDNPILHFGNTLGSDPSKFSGSHAFNLKNKKGIYTFKLKTKDSFDNINMDTRDHLTNGATGGTIVFKYMILEGDHTQNTPSYFEGLKSVGQDVDEIIIQSSIGYRDMLRRSGYDAYYDANGNIVSSVGSNLFGELISVKPNTTYTVQFNQRATFNARVYGYSSIPQDTVTTTINQKIFEADSQDKNFTVTFTTNNDINYILIGAYNANIFYTDYIIEPHSTYRTNKKRILYYNEETQTWEKPILRQWDNIEKHSDGKYYYHKRSGEAVLNGNEFWELIPASDSQDIISFNGGGITTSSNSLGVVCDKFSTLKAYGESANFENIFTPISTRIQIRISKAKLVTQDVAGFKKWLSENNVTVVYQLAEEKVYECTDLDLIIYNGGTNLVMKSGVLSPKTTLKLKSGVGNVVSMLQRKVTMLEDLVNKLIQSK